MADVITWTTPTLTEAVEGVDLTDMDLYITVAQISPSGSLRSRLTAQAEGEYDGTDTYVTATFTQEQTGQLRKGRAQVMVNAVGNDVRYATEPIEIMVEPNAIPNAITEVGDES